MYRKLTMNAIRSNYNVFDKSINFILAFKDPFL